MVDIQDTCYLLSSHIHYWSEKFSLRFNVADAPTLCDLIQCKYRCKCRCRCRCRCRCSCWCWCSMCNWMAAISSLSTHADRPKCKLYWQVWDRPPLSREVGPMESKYQVDIWKTLQCDRSKQPIWPGAVTREIALLSWYILSIKHRAESRGLNYALCVIVVFLSLPIVTLHTQENVVMWLPRWYYNITFTSISSTVDRV